MESTADRRKRLKTLRAKAGKPDDVVVTPEVTEDEITVKFRNYNPTDDSLKEQRVMTTTTIPDSKQELQDELKKELGDDEGLLNVAPKKPNWDLKRDVEKKLTKLNKRTQRAIVEIIRERLENEVEGSSSGEEGSSSEEGSDEESDEAEMKQD